MCLMCEEEAFYRVYMEYMAHKAAESAAGYNSGKVLPQAETFKAENVHAAPAPTTKT